MKNQLKTFLTIMFMAVTVLLGTLSGGELAYADGWPLSVQGTWSAIADQTIGKLIIQQPPSPRQSQPIKGSIFGDTIDGFYNPNSGRIVFARKSKENLTFQHYEGNLSHKGAKLYIGGGFSELSSDLGEYNFSANK